MLPQKQRNLEASTPIEDCISKIEISKGGLKQKVLASISEFKKKTMLSLEKAEKLLLAKINQACMSSLDALIRVNALELHAFQVQKYVYKTQKMIDGLDKMDIEEVLKKFFGEVKTAVDQLKKMKVLQEMTKISQENVLMKLEKTIKVQGQPLQKLLIINQKLVQIRETSVTVEKSSIHKHFQFILPVTFPNKSKQIFFTLSDSTIGLYNDKLILHSYKKFAYNGPIRGVQIGKYIIIAENYKITRMNLCNLNEIKSRTFNEEISQLGNTLHHGLLQVGIGNFVFLIDLFNFEVLGSLDVGARVRGIVSAHNSDFMMVMTGQGIKMFKNLELMELPVNIRSLKGIFSVAITDKFIVVTSDLRIYFLFCKQSNDSIEYQKINQTINKNIRDVVFQGFEIYCLAQNGNRVYMISF